MPSYSSHDKEEEQRLLPSIPLAPESQQTPVVADATTQPAHSPSHAASGQLQPSFSVSNKETGICRICLEEDVVTALEAPCACAGTQRYAHHACIQRWIDEKGNAKCEICEHPYQGQYTVPPAPVSVDLENMHLFGPMLVLEAGPHRSRLDLLDTESNHNVYHRNSGVSWLVTFVIFFMMLVVLHHTLVVADGIDYEDDGSSAYDPATGSGGGGGMSPGGGPGGDVNEDYASSLIMFFLWVITKFALIGIPLYTVMKIAARQARREQYEAMLRAGAAYEASRRLMMRASTRADTATHNNDTTNNNNNHSTAAGTTAAGELPVANAV